MNTSTRLPTFVVIWGMLALGSAQGREPAQPASAATSAPLASALSTYVVQPARGGEGYVVDGTVEALRDSRVAAQVSGRITEVAVHAGDRVQAGQVLMRIDPALAAQQVAGSQAQVAQAQALLTAARADLERAQRLRAKNYLSQAALDHAQAQFAAASAQARALQAQAAATQVQAGYFTVKAPYAGWVAQVPVSVGDVAAPGMVLAQVYDPAALRVTASLPESVAVRLDRAAPAVIELGILPADTRRQTISRVTVLPALDAGTHSATVRIALPPQPAAVVPGLVARVRLALAGGAAGGAAGGRMQVPTRAVVQRGEMSAVYVVTPQGTARLRQVRLGRIEGDFVEILAGVSAGDAVALDPVAAARATLPASSH